MFLHCDMRSYMKSKKTEACALLRIVSRHVAVSYVLHYILRKR